MTSWPTSVVIPTYRRPDQLDRLLKSLESVPADLDVVVVDDGSPPGTYTDVMERHRGVRWEQGRNTGPAGARNRGWRVAEHDRIVFLDDDCVVDPASFAGLSDALGEADAVGAAIEPLCPGHLVADFMHAEHLVSHKVEHGEVRWLVTACLAIRRSALEALDGFDERLRHGGEDADLSLRLRAGGYRLAVEHDVVVRHDHRAGLRQLVRTYYRHGTGQRRLADRHAERRDDLGASTRKRLSPSDWYATYRRYRADANVRTSLAYIALRAAMMVPWLTGAAVGSRSR